MTRTGTVTNAEAYTVACPLCKSQAGFTCTYVPQLRAPRNPSLGWTSESGQPTKQPHIDRREAYRRKQLAAARRQRDRERLTESKRIWRVWQFSIARSIRDGALRDQAELVAWLRDHAQLLTDLDKEGT